MTSRRPDEDWRSVLFVTAVSVIEAESRPNIDEQTYMGLRQWVKHFDEVRFAGIALSTEESFHPDNFSSSKWVAVGEELNRVNIISFPRAWKVRDFLRNLFFVSRHLRKEIKSSRYVCCTLSALIGDWGTVAALIAYMTGKSYAVHLDVDPTDRARHGLRGVHFKRRVRVTCESWVMKHIHRFLVSRSSISLLQGQDVFNSFERFSRRPFRVYDTHLSSRDKIQIDQLEQKISRILSGSPLKIVYAGRLTPIKGPDDWVEALASALRMGVHIDATWFGDGPSSDSVLRKVRSLGLTEEIKFPGSAPSRQELFEALRAADIFLFCHLSQESPRCLIEALACGAPIVGYQSPYAQQLVANTGGGIFTPSADVHALAEKVRFLDQERQVLADLVRSASRAGKPFDETRVYHQRAALIARSIL